MNQRRIQREIRRRLKTISDLPQFQEEALRSHKTLAGPTREYAELALKSISDVLIEEMVREVVCKVTRRAKRKSKSLQ